MAARRPGESSAAPSVSYSYVAPQRCRRRPPPQKVVIHHGVICDICHNTVRGTRYRCYDCDHDECQRCHRISGHGRAYGHSFQPISRPSSGVTYVGCGCSHSCCTYHGGCCSCGGGCVIVTPAPPPPPPLPTYTSSDHACNNCSHIISGRGYRCTSCSDYDLCASCFNRGVSHTASHSFSELNFIHRRRHYHHNHNHNYYYGRPIQPPAPPPPPSPIYRGPVNFFAGSSLMQRADPPPNYSVNDPVFPTYIVTPTSTTSASGADFPAQPASGGGAAKETSSSTAAAAPAEPAKPSTYTSGSSSMFSKLG